LSLVLSIWQACGREDGPVQQCRVSGWPWGLGHSTAPITVTRIKISNDTLKTYHFSDDTHSLQLDACHQKSWARAFFLSAQPSGLAEIATRPHATCLSSLHFNSELPRSFFRVVSSSLYWLPPAPAPRQICLQFNDHVRASEIRN
jgi:hypothetical protein